MSLADLGAARLAQIIANGEASATDVAKDHLARIEDKEPGIGAWHFLDSDFVMRQAERLDALRATGMPTGPLHGVPVGIKDIIDTKEMPTELGSPLAEGRRPAGDATLVNRLKAAGALLLGKTVTTEFAVYSPGKTKNPHNPAHTPGGSSSGSAAAVAAAMTPLAIGTQTNGSMIRPASFCGVVGFKPSHGRISRAGILDLSRKLDHPGIFARSVEDAALLGDVLFGHDPADPDTAPAAAPRLRVSAMAEPPVPPRYAFVKGSYWDHADAATREAFGELRDFLGDAADDVELHEEFANAVDYLRTIMFADLAVALDSWFERGAEKISPVLTGMVEEGRTVTALAYNKAASRVAPMNLWLDSVFSHYDAIITPATPGEAPAGLEATGDPVFCSTWSLLGTPAVTLPLLQGENGLPIGVQLVAAKGDDARLLRTARALAGMVAEG
jgi:Asp-tRNA(Asn)/Glu-tRNA(Gln) amidotransferase A subunit family amidase